MNHIADERTTRERFSRIGDGTVLTTREPAISWCGREIPGGVWRFLDATHALLHLRDNGGIQPCHDCLRAIQVVVSKELGERWNEDGEPIVEEASER